MELAPRLIEVDVPEHPEGAVLVLHGGASRRGEAAVSPTQLSVLRMIPIARRIARAGRGRLAVFRLLNSQRGWSTDHTPVQDARWALGEMEVRLGGRLPTCLVGHSLGGRAALMAVGEPGVVSAVALAPWVYPSDVPPGLHGQRVLIVHGTADRVADPRKASALARAMSARAEVQYVPVEGAKHAMLRQGGEFERRAADFAVETLLGAGSLVPAAR